MKQQIAIVVLNYINYKDTIECVNSILANNYEIAGIVIVDNDSPNESMKVLKTFYKDEKSVSILKSRTNQGYARGNNIGIAYARKHLKADFLLIANNDTIFTQKNYLEELLSHYKQGVGIIGSRVESDKIYSNALSKIYLDFPSILMQYLYFMAEMADLKEITYLLGKILGCREKVRVLYGCCVLLTPSFFEYYRGFYPHTFLYYEENIVALMLKKAGLKEVYTEGTWLFHKESESFNHSGKSRMSQQYLQKGYIHVLLAKLLPQSLLEILC